MQYCKGPTGFMSWGNAVCCMEIAGSLAAVYVNPAKEKQYYLISSRDGEMCNDNESYKLLDEDKY
eukprot:13395022-Ditylum_brightwellii.AAC.1